MPGPNPAAFLPRARMERAGYPFGSDIKPGRPSMSTPEIAKAFAIDLLAAAIGVAVVGLPMLFIGGLY